MLTDLITKFSKLKEGEIFVLLGEPEILLRKTGSRKAVFVKTKVEKRIFADDEVLTYVNAKLYYDEKIVGSYN